MRVADYRCSKGHIFEQFTSATVAPLWATCDCGQPAEKVLSAPRFMLEGVSGDFPGAAMKWDTRHEKAHTDHVKKYGPDHELV
jgi:hypothetical protein